MKITIKYIYKYELLVIDDMNSDLAYSCDVHPDGTVHFNIDRIYIFDINLI